MSRRPLALPGLLLGTLDLADEPWELRAADLAVGGWARRIVAPRYRRALAGLCARKERRIWVCVRQSNIEVARTIAHEAAHALTEGASTVKEDERWARVCEQVVGGLARAGVLALTLRDRQLNAVRRQLLSAAEAAPYEGVGRLEPAPVPWVGGLR